MLFSLLIAATVLGVVFALWQKNPGLIIGVAVAGSVHIAGLFAFNAKPKPKPVVMEEAPAIEVIEMPPLEPEEPPEIVKGDASDEAPPEYAPPMQADVPSVVTVDSFVQPLQPPPPEAPKNPGAVTIPVNRGSISSKVGNLFDIKDLDQIPQATYQVPASYPFEMKREGISGRVVVGFIVDSRGEVRDAYVIESSHPEFESPALQAVLKWRFRPGRKSGKAVNTKMAVPIVFNISNS